MTLLRPLLAAIAAALLLAPLAEARPRASVEVTQCRTALDPELRLAAFEGRMRRIAGAERMQMRFTLQQRGVERWANVGAQDWGEWTSSDAGVAEYHYTKEVGRLAAPAVYRTVVRFRWVAAAGEVLARRRAVSQRCRQPDLRPDVEIRDIEIDGGRYVVHVRNAGPTRAAASELELVVDGDQRRVVAVPPIKARTTRAIELVAPRCSPGGPGVSAVADFSDAIDERDETDNGFARDCPILPR